MKRARLPWRDFAPSPAVDAAEFQDETEPYPRHWRRFPESWPPGASADPTVAARLADAVRELPATWRAVVSGTDVQRRDPTQVAADLGLSPAQERAVRNRARAFLRERLADHFRRGRR
jgi:DNA-directed RNA polymerase specialized sigma24 family protein